MLSAVRCFWCASFRKRTFSELTVGEGNIFWSFFFCLCRISCFIFSLRKLAVSGRKRVRYNHIKWHYKNWWRFHLLDISRIVFSFRQLKISPVIQPEMVRFWLNCNNSVFPFLVWVCRLFPSCTGEKSRIHAHVDELVWQYAALHMQNNQ